MLLGAASLVACAPQPQLNCVAVPVGLILADRPVLEEGYEFRDMPPRVCAIVARRWTANVDSGSGESGSSNSGDSIGETGGGGDETGGGGSETGGGGGETGGGGSETGGGGGETGGGGSETGGGGGETGGGGGNDNEEAGFEASAPHTW